MTQAITTEPQKPKYRVPALEKGLDILESLSEVTVAQSQTELARALGRSTSELFRMLACLEERGYILRDEHSGRYSLSLKLYELAHTHTPADKILQAAREPMREFADAMRESIHLGILKGHDLLILAQEESPEAIRISLSVGIRQPAIRTTSGCLLLAHLPEEEGARLLADDIHYRDLSPLEREHLQEKFRRAREDGYVVSESSAKVGVRDISVLIGSPRIGLTAALASPILMNVGQETDVELLLENLQEKAHNISERLGLSSR